MADQPGTQTPNTADVEESELREMKVDQLGEAAKDAGVSDTFSMKKEELVLKVAAARAGGGGSEGVGGAGPDEHGDRLGVLGFDFGGGGEHLRAVSWQEWFETFDARPLNFIDQQRTSDGTPSNFFRLESPDREDG